MIKILIVEDDEELCEELKEALERKDYLIDVCYNGKKGIEAIKVDGYALVLLDLKMPITRGEEVLKYIKEKSLSVKVLILTGSPMSKQLLGGGEDEGSILLAKDDYRDSVLKKADGIMNKPYDMEKLLARIQEIIGAQEIS